MPTEFLFNHRFIYQNEVQGNNESPAAEKADKKLEAPKTIKGSKEFSDQRVLEAQQIGANILNKYRDSVPNPENLTSEKLAELAKTHPENILGSAEQLKNRREFPKILETAARTAAEKNPSSAVVLDMAFKNESYHSEVLTVAFNKLIQSDPRMAEYVAVKLGNSSETKALLTKAQTNLARFNHYT